MLKEKSAPEPEVTEITSGTNKEPAAKPAPGQRWRKTPPEHSAPVLTLEVGADVETQEDKDDASWHDIKNSQIKGSHLTGILSKAEHLENGGILGIVDYKGQRIAIPSKEMMLDLSRPENQSDEEFNSRSARVINRMMGAEIDFVVRGITGGNIKEKRAAVASRKAAMLRLRQRYYLNEGANGKPQVYPGRIVEARIVAVSQLAIRVEIFGVETTIFNRDLSWGYTGDCRNVYFVGDAVLVCVKNVEGDAPENISINADIKSLTENTTNEKLMALKPQTNCVGKVIDVGGGMAFISLTDGVKAISHKCYDRRKPGRGDDVMFVCTRIDLEKGIVVGIIPRIIRRNI